MTNVVVHPSTLEGIKRLAKNIKRQKNISHAKALDEAARSAGFQNLRHAQNILLAKTLGEDLKGATYPLYVTAYWHSAEGAAGRETLLTHTRQCWPEQLKTAELNICRSLRHFRIDAVDHLETARDTVGQDEARDLVCAAMRDILFMDATGLRPATSRFHSFDRAMSGLPGKDHSALWIHPETSQFVFTDEPYDDSAEFVARRTAWAKTKGFALTIPRWAGMYVPRASELSLVCYAFSDIPLEEITRKLDALPFPPVSDRWTGESSTYTPVFVSPGRHGSGRAKRARRKAAYPGDVRDGAIAYSSVLAGLQWRPNGKMRLPSHRTAGQLLKALLESDHLSVGTQDQIDQVRSELDDWVQREYKSHDELSTEAFNDLYYGATNALGMTDAAMLEQLIQLLTKSYPNCAPLRSVMKRLISASRKLSK